MNYLNDCFHRWHSAPGSCEDDFLLSSNGIPLQDFIQLYIRISNKVTYRDPENGTLAIAQEQVYMPHKCLWGKFNVCVLFNCFLDDQFRSASFNLQQLKLWITFSKHTSMAYDKWEWKIDHLLMKSTRNSLPSMRPPSTIVCQPG